MSKPADTSLWQLSVTLPLPELEPIEQILEDHALTISTEEAVADGSLWTMNVLFEQKPGDQLLQQLDADLDYLVAPLVQKDWVSESQKMLPPVDAGRFYIHGSHDPVHPSISRHDLTIEAGRAFGTGLHETTFGCLLAIDDLRKKREFYNALDLGCGSGVLALAIAKAWRRPVLASDIDIDAVLVTNENAKKNGLAPLIKAEHAAGLNSRILHQHGPYDLIVANILAKPLVTMAFSIANALADNGVLILSGLLGKQEQMVFSSYRLQGLRLQRRYAIGEWRALVLSK
ncbi:50S ribosomal protein L11 methyltransferase [Sneathiella marina]|uniref:Ribosomal protein L11 methyltransferase n=1 Tax=Sneathiella marina TaxID=2950108 RepID=A0ABY4W6W2_9PROT|nr:50S ribosomal protein L11 methyltransferase [Sneathiella marina]USG60386.1 50S ribosomal protein L11 methyltransferase [Sneathiella marina]